MQWVSILIGTAVILSRTPYFAQILPILSAGVIWFIVLLPTYSTTISYTSSFRGGTQEGTVVVYMYSQADGSIATAAMQKVMLSM
jgi:hypothetical protein